MCSHAVQSSLVAASEFHVPGCESDADAAVGVCVCQVLLVSMARGSFLFSIKPRLHFHKKAP